jgi:hypothetical protein
MNIERRKMSKVRRREPRNPGDPGQPAGPDYGQPLNYAGLNAYRAPDASLAWILCSVSFFFLAGEVASLVFSVHSARHDTLGICLMFFVVSTIPASLLGLFALRAARLAGSRGAQLFSFLLLAGIALGMGGMLAIVFCGAV